MSKIIFVAFAMEDEVSRNLLKGQSLLTRSPFEYVDMSVKTPYDDDWKRHVRTRIRRSDGVIALVSKHSLTSTGQQWELQCASEERVRILGLRVSRTDTTQLAGIRTVDWAWDNIANFIDTL